MHYDLKLDVKKRINICEVININDENHIGNQSFERKMFGKNIIGPQCSMVPINITRDLKPYIDQYDGYVTIMVDKYVCKDISIIIMEYSKNDNSKIFTKIYDTAVIKYRLTNSFPDRDFKNTDPNDITAAKVAKYCNKMPKTFYYMRRTSPIDSYTDYLDWKSSFISRDNLYIDFHSDDARKACMDIKSKFPSRKGL
jgi:hypothetical protein